MLNILAPVNSLGYGHAGKNIVHGLVSRGHNVSLFPIGQIEVDSKYLPSIKVSIENSKMFDVNDSCIRIWHQNDMAQFVGRGLHIGFPIFELDTFSTVEKHHLNSCDVLFVCSEWAKSVCINNGINIPIYIVPLGIDTEIFTESKLLSDGPTIFLNCGKWEIRKGHDILIEAWKKAFNENDNAQLWMCNSNPFLTMEETNKWESLYKAKNIRLIPRLQSHEQVATMMQMATCGVFPSRAEGWNLEALEMLACGKHLIITNYSAHTEYCNKENSMLIDIQDTVKAVDNKWFHGNGNWANVTGKEITQISEYMREVYEKHQNKSLKPNMKGIETGQKFSWNNTVDKLLYGVNDAKGRTGA